ncbi:protoheme IX farnesyltransferase [Thiogranum longum]|uniref:Protoheme IX farnesyltransferase n=1 Tax=Thiogranum longum TaxID=1537524 RepID=A0A4R1H9C5_9GAMM|nr:heme o synthase [Thiogranum longum]TCK17083.1 protoheme IX farnesyltransferase [Thiogranum longum]
MGYSMTAALGTHWRDYLGVCKLKVVALIVFTALVGMFLAVPGMVPWQPLVFGTLGIGMAAASAAAINHVVDQYADAQMARTRNRPVASGAMTSRSCLIFALVLGALAMWILVQFVNMLTAILTFASLIGYAVIYTLYLKRATPQNIVIGGAAGAAPPVLGWTAVTGTVDPHALLLFLIIFVWTPPHFWALAIHRRSEYAKVDIPMLPVTHGVPFTRLQVMLYTILLVVVTILPFVTHMSGLFYLAGALGLGAGFLYHAWALMHDESDRQAMKMFGYSIIYLMALFAFLLVDHYVPYLLRLTGLAE